MNKKQQIIIDSKSDQSIYDIVHKIGKYKLTDRFEVTRSTTDDGWTNPGAHVLTYINTGNGIELQFENQAVLLDYEQLAILRMLFHVVTTETIPVQYMIMEHVKTIKAM